MDPQELIQAVTEMEERARLVPATVKRVADLAGEYHEEVEAFVDRLAQKKERVTALKAKVDGALDALAEKASSERPVLEGGMKQIETAVEQAREAVSEAAGELENALDATASAVSALKAALADAAERAEAAQSAASADLAGLRGQMTSSESGLETAVGTAVNTTDGVEQEADEARDKVVAGLDALSQRMTEYADMHVGTRLDRASAAVEDMLAAHRGHLDEVIGTLEGGGREVAADLGQQVEENVTEPGGEQVARSAEAYLELEHAHEQAQASCSGEREETATTAADLQEWIRPMNGMVEQVRQAADRASTPWPA